MFPTLYEPYQIASGDGWAAFYKPPGRETISADGGPDMVAAARRLAGLRGLFPVHRLDRDTSGVQLMADGAAPRKQLEDLFRKRAVDKVYLALCLGVPRNRTGSINRALSEWGGGRRPVRVLKQGGLEAATSYRVLSSARTADRFSETLSAVSLVAFSPHQGRTHQIRVHAASLGYPILGDDQYGDRSANRVGKKEFAIERQALHCFSLGFEWRGERVRVVCPPAPDMRQAAEALFGGDAVGEALGRLG